MPENDQSNWPTEVLNAYGRLELPSLWDYLSIQEHQALELSEIKDLLVANKQQIKDIQDKLSIFDQQFELELLPSEHDEELEEDEMEELAENEEAHQNQTRSFYPAWEVEMMKQATQIDQRQWEEAYLAIFETVHKLLEDQQAMLIELKAYFDLSARSRKKEKRSFFFFLEERIQRTNAFRHQLMTHLADQGIEVISPKPGDLFDEDLHRVVEQVKHRNKKTTHPTIAELVHCGYYRSGSLIRQADVIIYR